jgi:hypothetical protein
MLARTALFDFADPMSAALWNLRESVRSFRTLNPQATEHDIWEALYEPSGVAPGSRSRVLLEDGWERHQRQISLYLLVGVTALFEGWIDEILQTVFTNKNDQAKTKLAKWLQYPTVRHPNGQLKAGSGAGLYELIQNGSPRQTPFAKTLRKSGKQSATSVRYSLNELDALLCVYRAFKEVRNAISHTNSIASQRAVDARSAAAALSANDVRMVSVPLPDIVDLNQPVFVSHDSVIAYLQVVTRLVTTYDAELCKSPQAEAELDRRWLKRWPSPQTLSKVRTGDGGRVNLWLREAGLPEADPPGKIVACLLAKGMIQTP